MTGDFDYQGYGGRYARIRRGDPRIAAQLARALGPARSVVNVGAGTGSYEPADRLVVAVEPSGDMRSRRAPGAAPVVAAVADALPFPDKAFDAALSVLSVHHWPDLEAGLAQMRRVARGPVVILTFDPEFLAGWWLADLCPAVIAVEARRYPAIDRIAAALGGSVSVTPVVVPADCTDGFSEAFFARPEAFLDPAVLDAQSAWGFVTAQERHRFQADLARMLADGSWDRAYGPWRTRATYQGAVRIIIAHP